MHKQIKTHTPVTIKLRFWSNGKIPESAYNRLTALKETDRDDDARVILDEWII